MRYHSIVRPLLFSLVFALLASSFAAPTYAQRGRYTPKRDAKKDANAERPLDEVGERYYIYDDDTKAFQPGGWMPTGEIGLAQSAKFAERPYRGKSCYRAVADMHNDPWMAVAFLPGGSFQPIKKINMFEQLGTRKGNPIVLRFWARSPDHATVQLKVGGLDEDSMTFARFTPWVTLTPDWKLYTIDLTGEDLSGLRGGLIWVIDQNHNLGKERAEFHLDEVYFTRIRTQ
jgi:hypothetical protein